MVARVRNEKKKRLRKKHWAEPNRIETNRIDRKMKWDLRFGTTVRCFDFVIQVAQILYAMMKWKMCSILCVCVFFFFFCVMVYITLALTLHWLLHFSLARNGLCVAARRSRQKDCRRDIFVFKRKQTLWEQQKNASKTNPFTFFFSWWLFYILRSFLLFSLVAVYFDSHFFLSFFFSSSFLFLTLSAPWLFVLCDFSDVNFCEPINQAVFNESSELYTHCFEANVLMEFDMHSFLSVAVSIISKYLNYIKISIICLSVYGFLSRIYLLLNSIWRLHDRDYHFKYAGVLNKNHLNKNKITLTECMCMCVCVCVLYSNKNLFTFSERKEMLYI